MKETKDEKEKTKSIEKKPRKTVKKDAPVDTKKIAKSTTKTAEKKATKTTTKAVAKSIAKTTKKVTLRSVDKTEKVSNASKKEQSLTKVKTFSEYYDLPYRYNQTVIKILAQTPHALFIYWDISDDDRNQMIENMAIDFSMKQNQFYLFTTRH